MTKINLLDGKYTVIHDNGRGLHALRYGEEWRNLAGDNLVMALVQEIEYLREGMEEITKYQHFDSPGQAAEVAEYYLEGRTD